MPVSDSGLKDLTWANLDAGQAVSSGAQILGALTDLLDGTSSLIPDTVMLNFLITAFTTDYNMKMYAIFSEDGVKSPVVTDLSETRKILVATMSGSVATDVQSNHYSVPVLGRYMRLNYFNDGSTGSVTLTSRYASSFQGSFSA